MIQIRSYKNDDFDRLLPLVIAQNRYHIQELEAEEIDEAALISGMKKQIKQLLKQKGQRYIVAAEGKTIVGYVRAEANPVQINRGHISSVYVVPEKRGQGIGTKLTNASVEWLKQNKVKRIDLFVHNKNTDAIKLYKSLGFKDEPDDYHRLVINL